MTAEFTVLDTAQAADRAVIDNLRADPNVDLIDRVDLQLDSLRRMVPTVDGDVLAEPTRWAYYPWRHAAVHILGPRGFRRLRLDRNRNMITSAEQDRLGRLRIGIVGLSVGHIIAHTLAAEGLCGYLRLADFDDLELSNLNRVPATVLDLGENKAMIAARRILELEPYLDVDVRSAGVDAGSVEDFLDGLDIVIDECDSLDVKAQLRRAARNMGLPVLMATSDRGLFDVERFDAEPERLILHGLLPESDLDVLATLSAREKVPHVLRIVDAAQGSARAAASMVEVGQSISTWPQLAGDVVLGAAAMAEAVRRIGLGEPLTSGRVRLDLGDALAELDAPAAPTRQLTITDAEPDTAEQYGVAEAVAAAANRAPSGGNSQPWNIEVAPEAVSISVAAKHSSTMDVHFRGSAVAIGASTFNARIAAAANSVLGPVDYAEYPTPDIPLRAIVRLCDGTNSDLARQYQDMLQRGTNRHPGRCAELPRPTADVLRAVAATEGGRLTLLTDTDDISRAAAFIGEADRIRYLTQHLHEQMISELRWPNDETDGMGIEVRSLELDAGDTSTLALLRRPDVVRLLADWDAGAALSAASRSSVEACSALAVVTITGRALTDYARGGSAVEAVWITAQTHGLSVHPISPVFLYAHEQTDFDELSADFAGSLRGLQDSFHTLVGTGADESIALVLRLSFAPPPSTRSLRRQHRWGPLDASL